MAKRRTGTRSGGTSAAAVPADRPAGREPALRSAADTRLPAWLPPAAYAVVALLLFREVLTGTSLLGSDTIGLSYFARNFYTEFVQAFHRMPYWNPLLFGGMPFVEGMHGDIFYPPSLALFFLDARAMWGWKMALHVFLAGVFTFLWLRRGLELDAVSAFFGGLVYMMGTHLVSLVLPGGDGKLFVGALAPLVFWLTERAVRGGRPADYALFALGVALTLFTSHMQAAYYLVWGVSLYFLFRVWQQWRVERHVAGAAKRIGLYALAGVLAVAAAAVQFVPPFGYLREHSHRVDRAEERGYEWSSTYSLNAEEIVSLVVPDFIGDVAQASPSARRGGYWGKNGFKLNHEYAGLIPLLLVGLLVARRRTAQVWFFVSLAALTLLYALASSTPLGLLFYQIPGVKLFRAWSIIIFLYGLAVATLGAIGVQQLVEWLGDPRSEEQRAAARRVLWIGAAAFGVLALFAASGALMNVWTALFYPDIGQTAGTLLAESEPSIRAGFWIAFLLATLVAAAWHAASRGYLTTRAFVLLLAVLAATDLYRVGRPFVRATAQINDEAMLGTLLQPDDVMLELQRRRDAGEVFRVLDLAPFIGVRSAYHPNDFAIHGIEQLAGHHGNELGRYRRLIGGEHPTNLGEDLRLADVTNTEYFVVPARIEHASLEEAFVGQGAVLYRNRNVLPRAYVVGTAEVQPGDGAIAQLLSPEFDARTTAILDAPLPPDTRLQAGATGTVDWLDRGVDRYTLRVTADAPALLVVLDGYYPAWTARVDGEPAPVYRANQAFRAVPVPAGEHRVEFRYEPAALRSGALISLFALALLLGVVAIDATLGWRRTRTPPRQQELTEA
jgi:hypothetical protein